MNLRQFLVLGVVIASTCLASQAAVVYEPFTYDLGALASDNGGSGWAGAWSGGDATVADPGLGYADGDGAVLPVEGYRAAATANQSTSFRPIDASAFPTEVVSGGKLGTAGATIWLSVIGKAAAAGANQWSGLSLYNGTGSEVLFIGNPYSPTNWGIDSKTGLTPTTNVPVDQERFILVKLEWNGDNTAVDISMWLNPTLDSEASLADVSADEKLTLSRSSFQFDYVRIGGNVATDWDEIRMGTTFGSVVPEPATLGLLAFGALGLLRRRRA